MYPILLHLASETIDACETSFDTELRDQLFSGTRFAIKFLHRCCCSDRRPAIEVRQAGWGAPGGEQSQCGDNDRLAGSAAGGQQE
jgi:hypothetical protein